MTWTRPVTTSGTVAVLAMLLLVGTAIPTTAADTRDRDRTNPPGHARFEGRHIDLTTGWGDARTCVVWTRGGEVECFRTDAEAEDAIAMRVRGAAVVPVSAGGRCGDWLTLYEHTGFAGRSLRFRDRGTYQDLARWGFAGQTSSYRVGSCATTLRDRGWTAHPGPEDPGTRAPRMAPGWNDRVRYVRIS